MSQQRQSVWNWEQTWGSGWELHAGCSWKFLLMVSCNRNKGDGEAMGASVVSRRRRTYKGHTGTSHLASFRIGCQINRVGAQFMRSKHWSQRRRGWFKITPIMEFTWNPHVDHGESFRLYSYLDRSHPRVPSPRASNVTWPWLPSFLSCYWLCLPCCTWSTTWFDESHHFLQFPIRWLGIFNVGLVFCYWRFWDIGS